MPNLDAEILDELRRIRALLERGSIGPRSNDPDYISPEERARIKEKAAQYPGVKLRGK